MEKRHFWDKRIYCVKPEVVGAVFEQLEAEYGEVTPENFLEASKAEDSPTHKLFEWNDTKAAALYRRGQAQQIILNLRIEEEVNGQKMKLPAYVNIAVGGSRSSYRNIEHSFQVVETRSIVLARAYNELETFRKKYEKFEEFANLFQEIEVVLYERSQ